MWVTRSEDNEHISFEFPPESGQMFPKFFFQPVFYVIQDEEVDLVGCLVCAEGRRNPVVADVSTGVDVSVTTTCVEVS